MTHTWNEEWDFGDGGDPVWNEDPDEYVFPFIPGSNSLTITAPDESDITLDTITFGKPDFLSDPPNGWYDGESIYIGFEVSGENPYFYEWGPGYQVGTWDASGTGSGYIRTVVTYYNAGDSGEYFDLSWGFLNPYTYNEGLDQLEIRMFYEEGISDLLFEPDEPSIE